MVRTLYQASKQKQIVLREWILFPPRLQKDSNLVQKYDESFAKKKVNKW
jgi:hypothetical protein